MSLLTTLPDRSGPPLLLCGLDSLYVSFYLDLATGKIDFDELGFLKERAKAAHNRELKEITLGSETFALMPYGKAPHSFVLKNAAFEIRLGERIRPSCHVQFLSEGLWLLGLDGMVARLDNWFLSLNLVQTGPEIIARADWAFDYHLPVCDFCGNDFVGYYTKRAHWEEHNRTQSFQLGTGDTVVRVYDKTCEIEQQSGKVWFYQLWKLSSDVWRVEFQVRGPRLKKGGIQTLEEMKLLQADLLREIANRHASLRRPNNDSNCSRWPLHPLWTALLADIAAMPQTGLIANIDPSQMLQWRRYQAIKSAFGYLKIITALTDIILGRESLPDFEQVLEEFCQLLEQQHTPLLWEDDLRRRKTALRLGQW